MYFLNLFINFILIINLCNFLKSNSKIETKKIFLISILILVSLFYILSFIVNFKIIFLLYICFSFIFLFFNFRNKFILNFKTVLYFTFFYFIFGFLTYERYFLDYDEFTYWGLVLKYFGYSLDHNILLEKSILSWHNSLANLTKLVFSINPFYHPTGIPLFVSIGNFFNSYAENSSIFFSNLVCLSGFFYLFFNKNENFQNLLKFSIFYLLLNNLSFGLISVYVDPIISVIFACILYELFNKKIHYVCLIILIFSLLTIHRSGFLFAIYSLSYLFFINQKIVKNKFFLILISTTILSVILNYSILANLSYDYFSFSFIDLANYIKKSLSVPIYFSSFGSFINTIFLIINFNFSIKLYQLSILFWFLIVLLFILFSENKKSLYLSFIIITIVHLVILFFEKINSTNYSLLVLGRYMGLLFLSYLLFINSKIKFNYSSYTIIIIFFLIITPAKTFGLFVPQKIYLLSETNYKFNQNRLNIKKNFLKYNQNKKQVIIIDSDNLRKNLSREDRNFYLEIIKYEIYPKKILLVDIKNKTDIRKYLNKNTFDFYSINLNERDEDIIKNNILLESAQYKNILLF